MRHKSGHWVTRSRNRSATSPGWVRAIALIAISAFIAGCPAPDAEPSGTVDPNDPPVSTDAPDSETDDVIDGSDSTSSDTDAPGADTPDSGDDPDTSTPDDPNTGTVDPNDPPDVDDILLADQPIPDPTDPNAAPPQSSGPPRVYFGTISGGIAAVYNREGAQSRENIAYYRAQFEPTHRLLADILRGEVGTNTAGAAFAFDDTYDYGAGLTAALIFGQQTPSAFGFDLVYRTAHFDDPPSTPELRYYTATDDAGEVHIPALIGYTTSAPLGGDPPIEPPPGDAGWAVNWYRGLLVAPGYTADGDADGDGNANEDPDDLVRQDGLGVAGVDTVFATLLRGEVADLTLLNIAGPDAIGRYTCEVRGRLTGDGFAYGFTDGNAPWPLESLGLNGVLHLTGKLTYDPATRRSPRSHALLCRRDRGLGRDRLQPQRGL